jgi:hypothetical protein
LFIKDYDTPFEDKASKPISRNHRNTHTHISWMQKFVRLNVGCGIYHKHTKYAKYADFVEYKIL